MSSLATLAMSLALACAVVATPVLAQVESTFDSAGVPISYVEQGSGEPVILLHGYTNTIENGWIERGVFGELAKTHRVIALDARGHGKSGKPHERAKYGPQMGLDVVRLMDHLKIERAHIVGYSMGAHIVAQLVLAKPERFLTLVLGGAAGRLEWTADDQKRVDIEAAEMDQGLVSSQIIRLWPKGQQPPSADELKALSAKRLAGMDPKALAAVRRSNPDQVVRLADLAATKVPTLGIVGTADPYMNDFERLKTAMPQLTLVQIDGASHGNAPNRPEFVSALKAFLAAHATKS
jgi:pimeloyl-ACP methyl ester carboxylesterase